jgi:hypothetical protein
MARTGRPRNDRWDRAPVRIVTTTLQPLACLEACDDDDDDQPLPADALQAERLILLDLAAQHRSYAEFRPWACSAYLDASHVCLWLAATIGRLADTGLADELDAAWRHASDDAFDAFDALRARLGFDLWPATAACHVGEILRIAKRHARAERRAAHEPPPDTLAAD